jgi:hypothetical protein
MCSFVFCYLVLFFYYFVLYISIWYRFFFRDASMAYILIIGYTRLSTHLVLRILANPRIYIVVLLYKSLSNPNISNGLYRCYFFFSHELIITCVLSMYGCVYFYLVHKLNSVTKRSLKGQIHSYLRLRDWFKNTLRMIEKKKKNWCNFLSKVNVLFRICMSLIPLQAMFRFTFNKRSISDLYTYFSREWESRKLSTCYRSKHAFGDLETFVTGELKSRAMSTFIEHPKAN